MSVRIKKTGASTQAHTVDGDGYQAKAVISEHGYNVKVTVDLNYNVLAGRRIANAHKAIQACLDSALDTANELRGHNPAMFDTDDLLDLQPAPTIEMDPDHA